MAVKKAPKKRVKKIVNTPVPIPVLLKKAEKVVNAWIRKRDAGKNCITCDQPGNQAGHYWPVRYSGVRFHPMNIHLQETGCNKWKYGNVGLYRVKLVEMYGEEAVKELDELAVRTQSYKWTREELQEIIDKYS